MESLYGIQIVRFSQYSALDALALKDGRPVSIIEFKARNQSYDSMYDTVILDLSKAKWGQEVALKQVVRFLFVVKLTDKLIYYNVKPDMNLFDLKVERFRLKEPRDMMDEDIVVHFPLSDFKVMTDDPETLSTGQPRRSGGMDQEKPLPLPD